MNERDARFHPETLALVVVAMGFLVFGLIVFAWPGILGMLELGIATPTARTEVRADFGGLSIGVGAFLLACSTRADLRPTGLLAALVLTVSIASARIIGMVLEGQGGVLLGAATAIELAGALLALLGWMATFKKKPAGTEVSSGPSN